MIPAPLAQPLAWLGLLCLGSTAVLVVIVLRSAQRHEAQARQARAAANEARRRERVEPDEIDMAAGC